MRLEEPVSASLPSNQKKKTDKTDKKRDKRKDKTDKKKGQKKELKELKQGGKKKKVKAETSELCTINR